MNTSATPPHPAPHYAALLATGWLGQSKKGGPSVQHLPVRLDELEKLDELGKGGAARTGTRVTLSAQPMTDLWGRVTELRWPRRVAPATTSNRLRFTALGRIRRVDLSEQLMILHIYRNGYGGKSFSLRMRGTPTLLAQVWPAWSVAQVWGSLIGPMLVVEQVRPHSRPHSHPEPGSKWAEVWRVHEALRPEALALAGLEPHDSVSQSFAGRYYLRGKPFKRAAFEELIRLGVLWRDV